MKPTENHLPSLFACLLFLAGGVLSLLVAILMGAQSLASALTGAAVQAQTTVFLAAFAFESLVLFAAAFIAFRKFWRGPTPDRELSPSSPLWLIALLIVLAGASIGLGYLLEENPSVNWLVLPLLTVPAIVLPLAALWGLGVRGLSIGAGWQAWGVFGLSMTLAPFLLFILEMAAGLLILIGVVAYILTQPELVAELQSLSQQLTLLEPDSEAAIDLLAPYLTRPEVIVLALIFISVLVPAIEEVLKPLGVWLLGRSLSPAQGFSLGALSGAGYALIETIGVSGQQSMEWATLLSSRIGTGLLHITTSALMGAAIVLALRERRALRLLGIYLLAVFLHGLWNALAIIFSFSALADMLEQPGIFAGMQQAIIVALILLAVVLLAVLLLSNNRWRKTLLTPALAPAAVPDPISAEEGGPLPLS